VCGGQLTNNKPIRHYFGRLLKKCCAKNYRCLQLYHQLYDPLLPQLKPHLAQITNAQYNFLAASPEMYQEMTNQGLLDVCYEHISVSNSLPMELTKSVEQRLVASRNCADEYVLMLTFYVGLKVREEQQI
jgi:hypothetical protein